MANYIVSDTSINQLLFAYLREMGHLESLTALQLETGSAEGALGSDLLYLNRLALEGRWEDVLTYLRPMQRLLLGEYSSILYIVKKQQYLESLCWQGSKMRAAHLPWRPPHAKKSATAGSAAAEEPEQELLNLDYICDLLKSLEPLCPNHKEYNSLLTNLTLEALTDNPDYKDWTVCGGRLECFRKLRNLLYNITPGTNEPDRAVAGGRRVCALLETLGMGLAYMESNGNPLTDFAFAEHATEENAVFDYSDKRMKPLAMLDHYNNTLVVPTVKVIKHSSKIASKSAISGVEDASNTVRSSAGSIITATNTNTNTFTNDVRISTESYTAEANYIDIDGPPPPQVQSSPARISASKPILAWEIPTRDADDGDKSSAPNSPQRRQETAIAHQQPLSWDVNLKPIDRSGVNDDSIEERLSAQSSSSSAAIAKFAPPLRRRSAGYEGRAHSPVQSRYSDTHERAYIQSRATKQPAALLHHNAVPEKKRQISNSVFLTAAPDSSVSVSNESMKQVIRTVKGSTPAKVGGGRSFSSAYEVVDERPQSAVKQSSSASATGAKDQSRRHASATIPVRHDIVPVAKMAAPHGRAAATPSSGVSVTSYASSNMSVNSAEKWDASQRVGAMKSADSSMAFTKTSTAEKLTSIDYTPLYTTNCPLRSVAILADANNVLNMKSTTIAIGSNARNIHTVKYEHGKSKTLSVQKQVDYPDVHKGSVYSMDWSPSLRFLASGSNDKVVHVTDVDSPLAKPKALKGHTGTVRTVKFSGCSEETLASGGAGDFKVRLWDLSSGSLITALAQHSSCIQSLIWLDEHTVLSGCEKGQLACSDVRSRRTAWTFDLFNDNNQKSSNICTLTKCSSDYVVAGCTEGYASIISSRDRSVVTTERLHSDDIRGVSAIAANSAPPRGAKSANIAYVTTSSFDGSVGVWKIDCHAPSSFVPLSILRGHTDKVLSTVFNQSNGDIITSGADGSVLLWRGK